MSLYTDILNTISYDDSKTDFNIYEYSAESNKPIAFSISGVYGVSDNQTNDVPDKPLEEGNFTVDSQNIKPYILEIKGAIQIQSGTTIDNVLQKIRSYQNGITLLQLTTNNTHGVFRTYEPLKLVAVANFTNVDRMIPQVKLTFKQVIVAPSSNYFTSKTANAVNIKYRPSKEV